MSLVSILHSTAVVAPDDPSYEVSADEWNDEHPITVADGERLLGRASAGTGAVVGLALAGGLAFSGSTVTLDLSNATTGVLPVARGGTGTGTAFTEGALVFAGAGGVYAQDATALFYDAASNFLGIGTNAPNSQLHVVGATELEGALLVGGQATFQDFASFGSTVRLSTFTAGRVLFATTNGDIAEDADFTFDTSTNTLAAHILNLKSGKITLDPTVANTAGNIVCKLNTDNAVTASGFGATAGFTWLSVESAGTQRLRIDWSAGSAIRFYAPGRMDFESAGAVFFTGTTFSFQAHTAINRTGDATSTATQKDSYGLYFQNSLWTGAAASQRFSEIRSKASTATNLAHTLKFYVNVTGGTGTDGTEVFALGYDGSAITVGFFGVTPIVRFSTTGTTTGHTGGGGTALTHSDTFTGNTGATAYTVGDVVRALKLYGLLSA